MLLWVPVALAGTAGVEGTLTAARTSARHQLAPGLSAWVSAGPRPWSVSGELSVWWSTNDQELYAYQHVQVRGDFTLDLALGTHATTFRLGLGPALTVRTNTASLGGETAPLATELAPGLRVRVALDGPIAGPLGFCWHAGATTRGGGIDWDAGLGLGVAW